MIRSLVTHGHNQIRDGGTSMNYFDLLHSGPKPITEMIVDSEEEMKEIQDSLHPIKCTDESCSIKHICRF